MSRLFDRSIATVVVPAAIHIRPTRRASAWHYGVSVDLIAEPFSGHHATQRLSNLAERYELQCDLIRSSPDSTSPATFGYLGEVHKLELIYAVRRYVMT